MTNKISSDNIFKIKRAKFYLPHHKTDGISQCIVGLNNYWDTDALDLIDKYLPDNAIILDIGANVGSHTVYWTLERNAKKIYSFEPLPDTFEILKTNIRLNRIKTRTKLYNIALSDEVCKGSIKFYTEINIGGTSFKKDPNGKIDFKPLDKIRIPQKIDLIKIDVEGSEVNVLKGALKTIVKNKPVIVIETYDYKKEVDNFMDSISYKLVETIREGEDYIYKYKEEDV